MNDLNEQPAANRHATHNSLRQINFFCDAPRAKSVHLTCDFNHWEPVEMQQRKYGWWYVQVLLCHGHHQYRFLVDGKPTLDPAATGVGHDSSGEQVSLIAVS